MTSNPSAPIDPGAAGGHVTYGSTKGRWIIAATALGSGIAFLDATVVNVALPAISKDLDTGVRGLQWILDAYLVTLSALLLLGGSVGDRFGRRRAFIAGLVLFVAASVACGAAPNTGMLIAARAVQGVGAAFLVPNSLSIISSSFTDDDRGRAIGAWSGLTGLASAIGPFVGGYLIDAVSWRLVFFINVPLAALAIWVALRHVPETRSDEPSQLDLPGAFTVTLGLAAISYALIEGSSGFDAPEVIATVVGVVALLAFVAIERRATDPMLPLSMFRSAQFNGANLTTLAVYGGLGGALFLVVLYLQVVLGYSALEAGAAFLPFTFLMLVFSPRVGALAQKIGPRIPMTIGPVVAGIGLILLSRIEPGDHYVTSILPPVIVFAAGMTLTVAPLTSTVLAAVDERHLGVASGTNNAVARLAGLLAVAVLPWLSGIGSQVSDSQTLQDGYPTALRISGGLCIVGGFVAFLTIREGAPVRSVAQAASMPCQDPCMRLAAVSAPPRREGSP
jgi:EmrB/QacA subfamily drug resistance transporter